ncbi:MAG: universal stress protein [Myxococcota bacterium]|nr:universal stress protein [Myxococcota bacterium]
MASSVAEDTPSAEDSAVVLAAVDTSTLASKVVEYAARLVRRTWSNSQLHVLHVYRAGRFDRPARAGIDVNELVEEARLHLDHHVRMARRQCSAPVTGHFAQGDPIDEVVKLARSLSADLVVVGTDDAIGLQRFLLGSVATKVAKTAPCPVLIVRQKQRAYTKL